MDKTKKSEILKSLKHAALIGFGGLGLLGAGYGAQRVVEVFTTPPPVTQTIMQAPAAMPDNYEAGIKQQFGGKSWQELSKAEARGDGHPVLVVPGFMTNDLYMASLRSKIEAQGYKTYGWHEGINLGASRDDADNLLKRVQEISAENGGQKVSLVGYSLGGVYARELARAHPELVRDVITLGAPFGQQDWRGTPDETLARINSYYQHENARPETIIHAPSVPTTSVYSKGDYLVDWRTSLNPKAEKAENVPIQGGHIAMPFNDEAAAVVLNRLAQKEGKWQPLWKGVVEVPGAKLAMPGA